VDVVRAHAHRSSTQRAERSVGYRSIVRIRLADPARDASAVAAIYRPAVERSIATFEEVAPAADEMASRIRAVLARTPWLVAEEGETIVGYAYAAPHHDRPGYRWSVNISVYVATAHQGRGIGRALYGELLAILRRQGFVNAYAGVALPNPPSVALHEAIGMRRTALYERVGLKFGAWHDVAWYALRLSEPAGIPPEPIALPDLIL
jgi:phosphinothricin acetyltransferase